MSIPTIMGKELFEIVDESGNPITTHFTSKKSALDAIDIMLKFAPERKLKLRRMKIVWDADYPVE
jgi:hypothetical protein